MDGAPIRWMNAYDSAAFNVKHRHARMFLIDLTVILQSCSPYAMRNIDFTDNLNQVFEKTGQSLKAASHILRDETLFQAFANWNCRFQAHW